MKSLKYYGPGSIRLEDVPVPKVVSGEVLVKVDTCGICATDLKTFLRGHPKIRPGSGLGHESPEPWLSRRIVPMEARDARDCGAVCSLRYLRAM